MLTEIKANIPLIKAAGCINGFSGKLAEHLGVTGVVRLSAVLKVVVYLVREAAFCEIVCGRRALLHGKEKEQENSPLPEAPQY